ncbi:MULTISPECIES: nucleoside triphosphate pyrophosphatase [unclassified Pseudactinotalea]|uniref:nucleoside triphosphate pyrophosphatase n=1 Tax=unclassified Pseudactinotalea TaxID=2649176 RepID=UPI00128BD70F|nr:MULTISPECIES: nucleoside triphosphate pyrophosphatase [unclassified Pseudactinotalea]MPV48801.1 septum formation inhibitor Maf [Pseudactinotalea sp. HY160]QGH68784.1 septum formation inhibitor Maf [Pseudactinotalea sp. HY158]
MTSLLLASASPARAATLRAAGVEPLIRVSHVDEDAALADARAERGPLTVAESVAVLAEAKARSVATDPGAPAAQVVLGCDSLLEFDGEGLGKPHRAEVARERWQRMRGRSGVLHTGHVLLTADGREAAGVSHTEVDFAEVTDAEIDAYIATGEPLRVAGAFTLDGLGGAFVSGVRGDHHGVVGLSLPLLRTLLAGLGIGWTSLWAHRTGA